MAVGVLTFHWAINYGAIIQAYALRSFIASIGYEAHVIDFSPSDLARQYSLSPFSYGLTPKKMVERCVYGLVGGLARTAKFRSFSRRFLGLTPRVASPDAAAGEFKTIVVGSDQVWNPEIVGSHLKDYLLANVCERVRRVSYAASLGISDLPGCYVGMFKQCLERFDRVSVRESGARQVLLEKLGIDAQVTLDPVFLLDPERWLTPPFSTDVNKPGGKDEYVLLYMLDLDLSLVEVAKKIARLTKSPLYCIQTPYFALKRWRIGDNNLYAVGPLEFPRYFYEASLVITNSFHGTAFSIIFQKPFLVRCPARVGGRIDNILRIARIENHALSSEAGNKDTEMLLDRAHLFDEEGQRALKDEIGRSKRFLQEALDGR